MFQPTSNGEASSLPTSRILRGLFCPHIDDKPGIGVAYNHLEALNQEVNGVLVVVLIDVQWRLFLGGYQVSNWKYRIIFIADLQSIFVCLHTYHMMIALWLKGLAFLSNLIFQSKRKSPLSVVRVLQLFIIYVVGSHCGNLIKKQAVLLPAKSNSTFEWNII